MDFEVPFEKDNIYILEPLNLLEIDSDTTEIQ